MEQGNKIYIHGGQLIVTEKPSELITILGSCVSVCIWDRLLKIGGMNHYLLPRSSNSTLAGGKNNGITSTQLLIQSMIGKTSCIKNMQARVYGGGNRFFTSDFLVVGPSNVEVAKLVLMEAGIPIISTDTGGECGRKINFNTGTGDVEVSLVA